MPDKETAKARRELFGNSEQLDTISRQEAQRMNEKAKEARRLYKREWNRKNREKVKAAQERYWERKAAAAAGGEKDDRPD